MSNPRHQRSGFSTPPQSQSKREMPALSATAQIIKEKKAIALINEGKLQEAEAIYKELISASTNNHIVYGNLAAIYGMQGSLDKAINLLRQALHINPNYLEAHNNLGNALQEQGNLGAAIASFTKALQINPNYSEAHYNLGNALRQQGNLDAAITSFNNALRVNSNNPEAFSNLGNLYMEQGNTDAAIACYKNSIQLRPSLPESHNNLGNAFLENGELIAAISSYNNALRLQYNYPEAHYNLGNALTEYGDFASAATSYNNALKLRPNYQEAYNNLGIALKNKGDLDAALFNLTRALEINPKYSDAVYSIGLIQAIKGDLVSSQLSFKKAIELNPGHIGALLELSKNIRDSKNIYVLSQKLNRVKRTGLSRKDESMIEFALSNLYHTSKEYRESAKCLSNANKLKLSFRPSDLNTHLLETKKKASLARQIRQGRLTDGAGKIFIIGAPRCGSTLLESVLTTNPNIIGLGETNALSEALLQIASETCSLEEVYAKKANTSSIKYTHCVDKNLYNFRFIEAIAKALPKARIIHCRRHPLDNILSMLRSNLIAGNNYTSNPLDSAKFLIHQEQIINQFKSRHSQDHIYTFDYDKFVFEPQKILLPLINWLGLPWKEFYLFPEYNNRHINTASVTQARQPIRKDSVGGWKNYEQLLKPAEEILRKTGLLAP